MNWCAPFLYFSDITQRCPIPMGISWYGQILWGFFFKLGSSSSCCDKNICYNTIYYIVPGGLTLREGLSLVEDIYDTGCLRALDLVEVNTDLADEAGAAKTLEAARRLILACLGNYRGGRVMLQNWDICHFIDGARWFLLTNTIDKTISALSMYRLTCKL